MTPTIHPCSNELCSVMEAAIKTSVISKQAILSAGKEIVRQSGLSALNMRTIAQRCSISVGSVYNYFPSKGDLVIATIESVWHEILYDAQESSPTLGFTLAVQSMFLTIQKGSQRYPSFFAVHPLSLADMHKKAGKMVMHRYFAHMKQKLQKALEQDAYVKEHLFTETFTQPDFVDFVFANMLTHLMHGNQSCDYLLEIIGQILYI